MRIDYKAANPEAFQAMLAFNKYTHKTALEVGLVELVKIRVSQLNGCAFCMDMHVEDALKMGESARRLYVLSAWREAGMFTEREKAALALSEALACISDRGVPQDVYDDARAYFSEREIVAIIMVVNVISGWNRLAVATGTEPPR
jgi:AhpD family alkylhydroperoxidase